MAILALPLMASCLGNDGPYQAGFLFLKPANAVTAVYANNTVDSVIMFSYGDWKMETMRNDGDFCSITYNEGKGNAIYSMPAYFTQNTTGEARMALFRVYDVAHAEKANAQFCFFQYATRGDGSLGNAPVVKRITGSDDTEIEMEYDTQVRPIALRAARSGQTVHRLTITYNDYDSTMTVGYGSTAMKARYDRSYQPNRLISATDTLGYFSQMLMPGIAVSPTTAFNVEFRHAGGHWQAYAYLLGGQSLDPDSIHNADSLRYYHSRADGTVLVNKWKLTYGNGSNRTQTVDANQLVYSLEEMNPFMLISLFRYARNSDVLTLAKGDANDDVTISQVRRNSDMSIAELTVTRPDGQVTYKFEY